MIRRAFIALVVLGLVVSAVSVAQAEDNVERCKSFYTEIANGRNADLIDEYVAENFVEHEMFPGLPEGRDGLKQFFQMMWAAFPDLKFDVEFMMSDGDKVAAYVTMTGTQKGDFMGMPASGKSFSTKTIDIVRIVDGRAVEHWGVTDAATMMMQLGAMPEGMHGEGHGMK